MFSRIALTITALAGPLTSLAAEEISFPAGLQGVINVRDFGAVGDGIADDTAVLQAAIDRSGGEGMKTVGLVYVPSGSYRITGTLVANRGRRGSGLGPWIWGQSRESVIIKLDDDINAGRVEKSDEELKAGELVGAEKDSTKRVSSVLQLHPFEGGVKTSANWFMRNVRHLTIDVGNNPDVDGVRYYASNNGILEDVTIRGNGAIGINCSFLGEAGPSLVQNCVVNGFESGMVSRWAYGQTICDLTIQNCRSVGLEVVANVIGIENLVVTGTPQAMRVTYPNDWHWWSGVVALVGGRFETTDETLPAIFNTGKLYLRDVESSGASKLVANEASKSTGDSGDGASVQEFFAYPPRSVSGEPWAGSSGRKIEIKKAPALDWEDDPAKWVSLADFDATPDGKSDDTVAFQAAIDHAAGRGATVVAIPPSPRAKRNWYTLDGEVRVHGSVRHIVGIGWARILGDGGFVVGDDAASIVRFEHISPFGGKPLKFENRSASSTMVCDSTSGRIIGDGLGDIFITNCPANVMLKRAGQSCWARQLNPETRKGGNGPNDALVANHGGRLWVMGTKSEGDGRRFLTTDGGRTEIYGAYEYTNKKIDPTDDRPIFEVRDAELFAVGVNERCFNGKPYPIKLRVVTDGETSDLDRKRARGVWSNLIVP